MRLGSPATVLLVMLPKIFLGNSQVTVLHRAKTTVANNSLEMEKMTNLKGKYVIVRTYSAGVFAGTLVAREGHEVELSDARRLWYWRGAASCSELALKGVSKPSDCKFPAPVDLVQLLEAIEILPVTAIAEKSIRSVKPWTA